MANILEQSFWFEGIKVDQQGFPVDQPSYIDNIDNQSSIFDDYNLFDCLYGYNRYIRLSELFRANTEQKWKTLLATVEKCDTITIVDDVTCKNHEIAFAEKFYMNSFYSEFKRVNPNCFVLRSFYN